MKAGFVAIAGRPNVGKSTLFNRLLGPELSIVSRRRQTTRYCVRGIAEFPGCQMIFLDTPGWQSEHRGSLNASLRRRAEQALPGADAGLLVVAGNRLAAADRTVALKVPQSVPLVIAFNKVDLVKDRRLLLPAIAEASAWRPTAACVPISALTGEGIEALVAELARLLPASRRLFPKGMVSDMDEGFFASEFVREQLFRLLGDELPYAVAVELRGIDSGQSGRIMRISADIVVDRPSCQAIVIGSGGSMIRRIGTAARRRFERFAGRRVHLDLRVVVRRGWHTHPGQLARLGLLEKGRHSGR